MKKLLVVICVVQILYLTLCFGSPKGLKEEDEEGESDGETTTEELETESEESTTTLRPTTNSRPKKKSTTTTTSKPKKFKDESSRYSVKHYPRQFDGKEGSRIAGGKLALYPDWNKTGKGEEAAEWQLPHQVSLRIKNNGTTKHFCGGTILDKRWILTAAHCTYLFRFQQQQNRSLQVSSLYVRMGITHLYDNGSKFSQEIQVLKIYCHEQFDDMDYKNDISLLLLKTPIKYNKAVKPIKLPKEKKEYAEGDVCTVSGWGAMMSDGDFQDDLRFVNVPVVSDQKCNDYYEPYVIYDFMLCAGFKKGVKDACQGDSGGPFSCSYDQGNDGATIDGIVSWGFGCAGPEHPGVYTQVSYFIQWITKKMDPKAVEEADIAAGLLNKTGLPVPVPAQLGGATKALGGLPGASGGTKALQGGLSNIPGGSSLPGGLGGLGGGSDDKGGNGKGSGGGSEDKKMFGVI